MKAFPVSKVRIFRRWISLLEIEGKSQYLRELEMWLKSFERYFSVVNLPLTDDELRQTTLRDYSEEVKIVSDVIFRVSQLCTTLLSEEQVSYSSFAKYIENSLRQDYFTDSYIRTLMRDQRPTRNGVRSICGCSPRISWLIRTAVAGDRNKPLRKCPAATKALEMPGRRPR